MSALTVSLQSEPLGNRSVLSALLGELLLDSEGLLGRLGVSDVRKVFQRQRRQARTSRVSGRFGDGLPSPFVTLRDCPPLCSATHPPPSLSTTLHVLPVTSYSSSSGGPCAHDSPCNQPSFIESAPSPT